MRILAIDPGPTTGFCLYNSKWAGTLGPFDVWMEEVGALQHPHKTIYNDLETLTFDELIVEKFEFRKDDQKRDKINIDAGEYVGVCKLYAQQNPHIKLVMQGSWLIGKTAFWSDDNKKVKELGLYKPKAAPHGMDALRHVLYYLSFTLNQTEWFQRLK